MRPWFGTFVEEQHGDLSVVTWHHDGRSVTGDYSDYLTRIIAPIIEGYLLKDYGAIPRYHIVDARDGRVVAGYVPTS